MQRLCMLGLLAVAGWFAAALQADEAPDLTTQQEAITIRYQRFENTLLQLAEYLRKTDPGRADLLVRAIGRSKEGRIPDQMQQLVQTLKKEQLGDALEQQDTVLVQLAALLDLLQSEDRHDDIEREKKRLMELIQDVDKLLGREKDARSATERGRPTDELQRDQQRINEGTGKLIEKIDGHDTQKNSKDGEGKNSPKPDGSQPDSSQPDNQSKSDDQPGEKSDKPSDPMQSPPKNSGEPSPDKSPQDDAGKPMPGQSDQPMEGQAGDPMKGQPGNPMEGQQGSPQSDQQQAGKPPQKTPGIDQLKSALEAMQKALESLQQEQRQAASDQQDQAIKKLLETKEKLEEILRQLREEERGLMLTALEARFRDMLAREQPIYSGTTAIAQIPASERTERHRNRAIELSRAQMEVALLAQKALTLLQEEGSSTAFVEALGQLDDDMQSVARRLERGDVGEITVGTEQEIIQTLEELISVLQQEIEKQKDKQQSQQPGQPGMPEDPSLVNEIAELKMFRSLQLKINRRTLQLGKAVQEKQTADPEMVSELRKLGARQSRLQQATYNKAIGVAQ